MKILHYLGRRDLPCELTNKGMGGVTRVALELARVQHQLGHEVWVVTTARRPWRREWNGVRLAAIPEAWWAPIHSQRYLFDLRSHIPLVKFCRAQRFDVVHGHEYPYLRFVPARLRLAHVHNNPFWTEQTPEQWWYQAGEFRVLRQHSDLRIAVSGFVAQQLRRGTQAVAAARSKAQSHFDDIHVVYNGVDLPHFAASKWLEVRSALRHKWGIQDQDVVFLFAGAIAPDKGVVYLARAFAELCSELPNVRLILAGGAALWGNGFEAIRPRDQEYETQVRGILKPAMDRKRVLELGVIPAYEMPGVYAASDVVIVPSLVEAFGLVIVEALASNRPVIASAMGGIPEITSRDNTILVPPKDSQSLATAMRILTEQPALRARLARNAEPGVHGMTWKCAAEKLDAIYLEFKTATPRGRWQ